MRTVLLLCVFLVFLTAQPLAAAEPAPLGLVSVINLSDGLCAPCKMMTRLLEKMRDAYQGELAVQTLYPLKDKAVAEKYAPKALPTLVFFNRQGQEVFRQAGLMSEAELRAAIDKLLEE